MICRFIAIIVYTAISAVTALSAENGSSGFTQRDFGRMIVNQFGWSEGLPKEPTDRDYLVILGGKRIFRFEAEQVYNSQTDNVTLRNYALYGPFSGTGWLMGVSQQTTANFSVMLPMTGEYSLKTVIKGKDFVWKVADRELRGGNSAGNFSEVDLGKIWIKAGPLQIKATIPPEGAIDSFMLVASDHRSIQPFDGWRFNAPLTALQMAQAGVALMDGYSQLPSDPQGKVLRIAAVDAASPNREAAATTANFLGPFTARSWLRAGHLGARLQIPLTVPELGYYELRGRLMGEQLSGSVNGTAFSLKGKPYLDMLNLGLFRLEAGENLLSLKLPPMGGIDVLELSRKSSSPQDVMRLAGVSGSPDRQVSSDEALNYIKTIREKHQVRK